MALFRYSSNTLIRIEPKGNATRGDVTNGKTFSSEKEGINATGILADWRSRTNDIDLSEIKSDGYVYLKPKGDARIDNTSLFRISQEKISGTSRINYFSNIDTATLDYTPDGVFLYFQINSIPAFYWLDNKYSIKLGVQGYNGDTNFYDRIKINGNVVKVKGDYNKFIVYKY